MTDKQAAREERSGSAASGTGAGAAKARETREKKRDESREPRDKAEAVEPATPVAMTAAAETAPQADTAGSITSVANAPAPSPEFSVDVAPLDQLIAIRQEQARLDQFRDRAASMKTQVDDSVFQRVVEDYTRRHRALEEKAAPLKVQARGEYRTLQAWRARVESTHEDARLIKQELQFRHAVGELDEAALTVQVREPEETLARCEGELASIDALHARFAEAFGSAAALDAEMRAESGAAGVAEAADAIDGVAGVDRAAARSDRADGGYGAEAAAGVAGTVGTNDARGASGRDGAAGVVGLGEDAARASDAHGADSGAMRGDSSAAAGSVEASSESSGDASADPVAGTGADGSRRSAGGFWNRFSTASGDAGAHATVDAAAESAAGFETNADRDGNAPSSLAVAQSSETLIAWPSSDGDGSSDGAPIAASTDSGSVKILGDVLGLASVRETLPPERLEAYRAHAARLDDAGEAVSVERGSTSGTHAAMSASGVLLELIDVDPEEAVAAGLAEGDAAQGAVRIGAPHPLGPSTTVGRADESQLRIPNPSVSRQHAVITATSDGYALRDLHSQNGTFVNGERIDQIALRDGDEVVFGDAPFLFRASAASPQW